MAGFLSNLGSGLMNVISAPIKVFSSVVSGVGGAAAGVVGQTLTAALPTVTSLANSSAGNILAAGFAGGGSAGINAFANSSMGSNYGKTSAAKNGDTAKMDGINVPFTGWRRYLLCWDKLDKDGFLVDANGARIADASKAVLDWVHIGIAAGIVLTAGIGIFYLGKSKRWW